jgi:hypothetical protein
VWLVAPLITFLYMCFGLFSDPNIAEGRILHTVKICRVSDKKTFGKKLFTDSRLPSALCRELHSVKSLPSVLDIRQMLSS